MKRLAAGAVVLSLGVVAALVLRPSPEPAPRPVTTDYALVVSDLQREIDYSHGLAEALPSSWTRWSDLAALLLSHARLTNDHASLARAEEALAKARQAAEQDNDRLRSARASLHASLHRFDEAERDLREIPVTGASDANQASVLALLGDLALARGRYRQALADYTDALGLDRDAAHLARLAFYRDKTGDGDAAERLYREALEKTPPSDARQRAWLFVQRGRARRDRGRYDDARRDYEAAERAFSGWPVVAGHVAEVDALMGRTKQAIRETFDLVESTADPEQMDALARLLRHRDPGQAEGLIARARAHFLDHLQRFPEAAAGHAVGHFLVVERDAAQALELARRDHALRPSGETGTRLAQALLLAGQPAEARTVIETVLSSEWRAADSFATAALVHERLGDSQAATRDRSRARAIRPDAMERLDWLQGGPVVATRP